MRDLMDNGLELDRLKDEKYPVVIYGALQSDEAITAACKAMGISVVSICDDSMRKAGNEWCGLPVYTFEEILEKYGKTVFIINISYLKPVVEKIEAAGCSWYSCKIIVESDAFRNLEGITELDYDRSEAERACYCHENYLKPGKLYMSNIDVVVTERCSLRCHDCSNLMQFYEKPVDYAVNDIIDDIERLLNIIDGIYELRFIGGEPFMHKDLHLVIKPFLADDRVRKLLIYSNASILPRSDQWEILSNEKVIFMITNYGPSLSRQFDATVAELEKRKIKCHILRMDYWNPCDTFTFHARDEQEQKNVFRECCVKNYVTLIKGKLFRCPYSAHAMNLKAVPENKGDYFNLDSSGRLDTAREELRHFLFEIEKLNTCQYCRSRSFDSELIPVAIQCDKPRKYERLDV